MPSPSSAPPPDIQPEAFLQGVARELLATYPKQLHTVRLVLPNRRSGLFLKQALLAQLPGYALGPRINSYEEYLQAATGLLQPEGLDLVFRLYEAYKLHFPEEAFEAYYSWGEMLLRDFDDLDKALAPPDKLLANLQDLKELEAAFADDEQLELIRRFWASLGQPPRAHEGRFLALWSKLLPMYRQFTQGLLKEGLAYEGLMARQLHELLQSEEGQATYHQRVPEGVWFVGFHGIGQAQLHFTQALQQLGWAQVRLDADRYLTHTLPKHEGGRLLRQEVKHLAAEEQLMQDMGQHKQTIQVIETSGQRIQARILGGLLEQLAQEQPLDARTAVVLPDEQMLFAVLENLPSAVEALNVTMGYPLRLTGLASLVEALIRLSRNQERRKTPRYLHRDLARVLGHPYLHSLLGDAPSQALEGLVQQGWLYIGPKQLDEHLLPALGPHAWLLSPPQHYTEAISLLMQLTQALFESYSPNEEEEEEERNLVGRHGLEREYLYQLYRLLQRLQDILSRYKPTISLSGFWALLRRLMRGQSIAFTGEPLAGLQVMGFLETRLLDFERIIVLGMNEHFMPPARSSPSYLPYSLRKAFGLPTPDEVDAVNAYNFYRLIGRAREVYLLYDSAEAQYEPSRYLLQLERELVPLSEGLVDWQKRTLLPQVPRIAQGAVEVPKTPSVLAELARYTAEGHAGEDGAGRALSPSAMASYLLCPLQFYLRYIANLQEDDETSDELDAAQLGTLVHDSLEALYSPLVGQPLSEQQLRAFINEAPAVVQSQAEALLPFLAEGPRGQNVLTLQMATEMVVGVLKEDIERLPFTVLATEQELAAWLALPSGQMLRLKGRLDRLDEADSQQVVIDYKTGVYKPVKPSNLSYEQLVDVEKSAHKANLQASIYAYLYAQNQPTSQRLLPAIYGLRQPPGSRYNALLHYNLADETNRTHFEGLLGNALESLLEPSVPFRQNKKPEGHCQYCAYHALCYSSQPADFARPT